MSSPKESRTSAFAALAAAIVKGFVRDKASVFFAVVFPLMFLVLFGGIFDVDASPRIALVQVGQVPLFTQLPDGAREVFEETFEVTPEDDLDAALEQVRTGDADAAVRMDGDTLVAHYTQTDQVKAAVTQGTLRAFVDGANVALSGAPPRFAFASERVEDESLQPIQFVTPGLLGWAVAMSASFGAAAPLQGWRNSKLLRRLQLAPVPPRTVVAARVVVTVLIALVQMAIFLVLGVVAFGLRLTGWWWVAVTLTIALAQLAIFLGLGAAAFGLTLTGSWWMSIPLIVVGTLCFMAIGLLAGAIAKSAEGAVNMANFFVLPMAFLSGSFFPLDAAPSWLRRLSDVLPLKHLNEGMLDVLVRGQGPSAALVPLAILAGFAVVVTLLAARLFRWDTA